MAKCTQRRRRMKKGGDIIQPQYPSNPLTPSPPTNSIMSWFNKASDAGKVASDAASKAISDASAVASNAVAGVVSDANSASASLTAESAPPPLTSPSFGGRSRKKCRKGGSKPNLSLTNIASTASHISGIHTAKSQALVGGKTKKRICHKRHKHTKSCKVIKSKKGNRKKHYVKKSKIPFSESLKRLIKM